MIRSHKLCLYAIFIILFFLSMIMTYRWIPGSAIDEIYIASEFKTESILRAALPALYSSYNRYPLNDVSDSIKSLSYVNDLDMAFHDGMLGFELSFVENAIIITDGVEALLFVDDALHNLDYRDFPVLKDRYIPLVVDSDYLSYLKRYGVDGTFGKILSSLLLLDDYSALITKAEYDNNKTTGKGSLVLFSDNLNAELHIADGVQNDRIIESIEAISEEVKANPENMLSSDSALYELRHSELVRIKR